MPVRLTFFFFLYCSAALSVRRCSVLCMAGRRVCSGERDASSLPNRRYTPLPSLGLEKEAWWRERERERDRAARLVSGYGTNRADDVMLCRAQAFHLLKRVCMCVGVEGGWGWYTMIKTHPHMQGHTHTDSDSHRCTQEYTGYTLSLLLYQQSND